MHKVHVTCSGRDIAVGDDETILDAALRQGLAFPYGCRNGTCGTCKGKIVSGVVDYGVVDANILTEEDRSAGLALFCQACPLSDLVVEIHELNDATEMPILKLPCRVERMDRLTRDVMRIFLKIPSGKRMQFLAGQYVDFVLQDGRHRSFSIANPPHRDNLLELHVKHVAHGQFTDYVFNKLKEKSILRIEGPYGNFYFREQSPRPIIFVAGGTGFAPIKAIIEHLFAEGVTHSIFLYWGVRSKSDLYMQDVVQLWEKNANFSYRPVLSEARLADHWTGRTGFVHEAVVEDFTSLEGYDVYASGPPVMVNAAKQEFLMRGLPEEQLFYDSFEFAPDSRRK